MTERTQRRTFVDDDAESTFRSRGFVRVEAFDPVRLGALWAEHERLVGEEAGITFDTIRADRQPLRRATAAAADLWKVVLDRLFVEHRVVFSAFVVKRPGDHSGMAPHDDRSFVDERTSRSVTAWIPLVDTGPEEDNGWIGVVPGSHRVAPGLGGTAVAEWFVPYREVLREHLVAVPARAGDAVVWDSRLIHGSPPNRSSSDRPALVVALVPREAGLIHVRGTSRRGRRIHQVDQEFHLRYSPLEVARRMPDYPLLEEVDDPEPFVEPAVIQQLCGLAEPPVPLVDRPVDDWYGQGEGRSPRGAPLQAPGLEALAGALEALTADLVASLEDFDEDRRRSTTEGPVVRIDLGAADPTDRATELFGAVAPRLGTALGVLPGTRAEVLILDGGASLPHPDRPSGPAIYLPLSMPSGAAGLAWSEGALAFELGLAVAPPRDQPVQVWNDGADQVCLLVAWPAVPAKPARRRSALRWLRARS